MTFSSKCKQWIYITNIRDAEIFLYQKLLISLGKGEASSIAIAKERNWGFLTDDRKARRIAQEQRVKFSGTLGILKSAVIRQVLTAAEADKLLSEMINRGYYSPYASINQLMK
jgi:predicted nucleic acid-binding protein